MFCREGDDASPTRAKRIPRLLCIDPAQVEQIWSIVAPLLRRATTRTGLSSFTAIERDILSGASLLWLAWNGEAIEAAASTSLQLTEAGKVCVITACAGTHAARWLPLIADIERYAEAEGCRCVRIVGRRGWARVLAGYRQTYAIIDKPLGRRDAGSPRATPS